MREPSETPAGKETLRKRSSRGAKERYPAGKAFGRIRYFETQRGLPHAAAEDGRVIPATSPTGSIARQPRGKGPGTRVSAPYAKASKVKSALAPSFSAAAALPVWRALGPSHVPKGQTYGTARPPVSGRCSGILISPTDPSHLVLCSGGGGLWESLDQGSTWRPLTDDQPTLSMGAIASAPSAPSIVYAGLGEGDNQSQLGAGLLRSSDGGQTWQLMPSNDLSGTGVFEIAVDPGNPLHLWVGTLERMLESVNGGSTWRVVKAVQTWDISINRDDPREIFAATEAGLIRSGDGGATWARVTLPGTTSSSRFTRLEVCHAPSKPAVTYATGVLDGRGFLWRRATRGGAFAAETPPPLKRDSDIAQAWYDWCAAVSPVDPNVLFIGAVELYRGRRSLGGYQWQNVSSRTTGDSIHPDQHHLAFDPSDPAVLYACNDGGVFRSPDAGTTWKSLNRGLNISEFEFLVHVEGSDSWLIGGTQDNGTLSNATAGTWDQVALGDGGDCGADEAQDLCYHSYYGMWIERARASGPSAFRWKDVSPPFADDYDALFYPPMDVHGSVVAKAGTTLFVSDDNGDNWDEVDFGGGGLASAVSIVRKNVIFVGTEDGALARITRGSGGWGNAAVASLRSPRGAFISDIVVPAQPNKVVWVSCSAFGGGHVFRSLNGGATWVDKTGNLPDIPVNAIVVDPAATTRVFAATDHGVYQTRNSGTKWTDYSNGLPNMVVGDLILHQRLRLLRVGTRNRGAWEVRI